MCVYPQGDKCAKSNCGQGTVCDPDTGECVSSGGDKECKAADKTSDNCTCNKKTGEWENCGSADACDGKACKTAGTCHDVSGTCTCDNGESVDNNCEAAADACEGKACKTAGTCHDVSGTCTCDNGESVDNNCEAAADACEGKACKAAGTCSDDGGVCKCANELNADNDCKSTCEGKSFPDKATSCSACIEATGEWNEDSCTYTCTDDGLKTNETCACEKGEWANCDFCKGKTLLVGQVCDSETGNVSYDPAPALEIDFDKTSISEDTWPSSGSDLDVCSVVTIKLNAEPSEDIKVTIDSDKNSDIYRGFRAGVKVKLEDLPQEFIIHKSDYNADNKIYLCPKDNNTTDGNRDIKLTFTATSEDANFNSMPAVEKTITVVDDDQPGIVLNCEKELIQAAWLKGDLDTWWGEARCDNDNVSYIQICKVKLAKAPTSDVNITIEATRESETLLAPNTTINGTKQSSTLTSSTLTFTSSNYHTEQIIKLEFSNSFHVSEITDTKPLKYTLKAKPADTTAYNAAEVSSEFTVRPMTKYIVINRSGTNPNHVNTIKDLPKGKYRLHAWGASGGLATDTNMATDNDGGFQCSNHGGAGAYIHGDITLAEPTTIYVYLGEAGKGDADGCDPAYNGGGQGACSINYPAASGGGGTDFCIGHDDCKNLDTHWPYRILVAGGGGAGSSSLTCRTDSTYGGTGGSATWQGVSGFGLLKGNKQSPSTGYNYTVPGRSEIDSASACASWEPYFGKGSNASMNNDAVGGCGGGWYGGKFNAGEEVAHLGGAAGSSFAFKGTADTCNHGKQDAKYALANVGGQKGLSQYYDFMNSSDSYFPFFKDTEVASGIVCSKVMNYDLTPEEKHVGNIGDGYAVIETLYDE